MTETPKSTFLWQLRACGLPDPVAEFRFHEKRRYRFDYAWPAFHFSVEYDGGFGKYGKAKSGHRTRSGIERDIHKLNLAQSMGWRVYRITAPMVRSGEAVDIVEKAMRREAIE